MNGYDNEMLRAIQNACSELVWVIADGDPARSADLLEVLAERLVIEAQQDRRKVKVPETKRPGIKH